MCHRSCVNAIQCDHFDKFVRGLLTIWQNNETKIFNAICEISLLQLSKDSKLSSKLVAQTQTTLNASFTIVTERCFTTTNGPCLTGYTHLDLHMLQAASQSPLSLIVEKMKMNRRTTSVTTFSKISPLR